MPVFRRRDWVGPYAGLHAPALARTIPRSVLVHEGVDMSSSHRWSKRAGFAFLLIALALPAAHAQSPAKTIRVGMLLSGSAPQWAFVESGLLAGLRDQGYVEGTNLVVVRRYGEIQADLVKRSAAELAAMNLDAIVTTCTVTTRAVVGAAGRTPIVMAGVADPVGAGFARSLARPGANVTGVSGQLSDLEPKRMELLGSLLPDGARVGVLGNPGNALHQAYWRLAEAAARSMNLTVVRIEARGPAGIDAALDELSRARVQGLLLLSDDPTLIEFRNRIAAAAVRLRIPSIGWIRVQAEDGMLMSYGGESGRGYRQTAAYVVRIANGANPAEMPIEQPTQFPLVINLKTAAAIGITVPRELLMRADEAIR